MIYKNIKKVKDFKGSSTLSPAHGWVGARATILSLLYLVPPSARKKFWPSNQAGEKEGGWGKGIFARLFCAVGAVGWKAFPPFGIKPNIKAKQFSNPFKRKVVAQKIKIMKRKLFCFARRSSAGGNAGAGFQIIRAIFARKRFELRSEIRIGRGIRLRSGALRTPYVDTAIILCPDSLTL
ncbi:MAG: hypothetical protein ABIJ28_01510 [Patescibacteria group bacterium]